ncbi:MAG TPA: ABC transporter permease [Erysipelotrichaceae bacterium]|nr:ABC transporter permease [Erysipelotrichaceae bacterium]
MKELIQYYTVNGSYVFDQFARHLLMSVYGVIFAGLIGIPLGFYIARHKKLATWVMRLANIIQTIPSLAMLSLVMIVFGLGPNTVVVTIFLYSLLPIISNTYAGVRQVEAQLLDIAKGMGMTKFQVILKVELPLAISMIIGGIRNALVVAIGIAAIGTFVGAGGLGEIITRGISVADGGAIVWAGALPTALMAVIADIALGQLEKKLAHNI